MTPTTRVGKGLLWMALLFTFFDAGAQLSKLDSLKKNITTAQAGNAKLQATLAFCEAWESYNPDTLYKYASFAKQLSATQQNGVAALLSDYYLAAWLFQKNKLDTALKTIDANIAKLKKQTSFSDNYYKFYGLRANILLRTVRFDEVMSTCIEMLKLGEAHNDTLLILRAKIGIGNANNKLMKYEEAVKWYYQVLSQLQNPVHRRKLSFLYNNLAILQYHLNNEDSCIYYVQQGLKYSREDGNQTNEANSLSLYGGVLALFKKTTAAEKVLNEALEVRKKIGDVYYIIIDLASMAYFYANLPVPQPEKGIALCKEGIELANKNGQAYANVFDIYQALSKNYLVAKDYKNYSETMDQIVALKDSAYQANSAEVMSEMQTKYEVQKKENTIIQQKLDLTKKNYFLFGSLGLLAITILAGFSFFKNRQKNQRLRMQDLVLEQKKKTTQAVIQAEEEERKRIATDLHDSVAQKMVVAKLNLEALEDYLPASEEKPRKIYNNIFSLVTDSCTEVRELSHNMMPQAFFKSGLSSAVKDFIDKIENSSLEITFNAAGNLEGLDKNKELMIFRIIQEVVQNTIKHAKARKLDISIIEEHNEIDVTIEDDGTGFDPAILANTTSIGMKNIKSRVDFLNGKLDINSQPGMGTVIAFYVPASHS